MKVFLLGATGKTGSLFLKMALERGHCVTAYVRSPEKMMIVDENLSIVKGDFLSVAQMSSAMFNHDVVVSCLGGNDNDKTTILTEMTQVIVNSMQKSSVGKIAAISTAGILGEFSWIMNLILKLFYKNVINDHRLAAQIIMTSGLEYTLARPFFLKEGSLTKAYRKTPIGVPKGGKEISMQDLAHFFLNVIENGEHRNETVGLAY